MVAVLKPLIKSAFCLLSFSCLCGTAPVPITRLQRTIDTYGVHTSDITKGSYLSEIAVDQGVCQRKKKVLLVTTRTRIDGKDLSLSCEKSRV